MRQDKKATKFAEYFMIRIRHSFNCYACKVNLEIDKKEKKNVKNISLLSAIIVRPPFVILTFCRL